MTWIWRGLRRQHHALRHAGCLIVCVLLLVGCGQRSLVPLEQAIVGTWRSNLSPMTFEFRPDGTFIIEEPGVQRLTGTYHLLGRPLSLSNAQFTLEGGLDIRFENAGDSFYIYIDGLWSETERFRREK